MQKVFRIIEPVLRRKMRVPVFFISRSAAGEDLFNGVSLYSMKSAKFSLDIRRLPGDTDNRTT
jgi:hypothetical protein